MHTVNWKDALVRAAKTFVAAAIPAASALPAIIAAGTFAALPAVLVTAGLLGAAAVVTLTWNVLLDWSRE